MKSKRRYKGVSVGSLGVILRFAGPMFEALNRMKKCFGLRVGVLSHPEVILGLAAHLAGAADEALNVLKQRCVGGPSWGHLGVCGRGVCPFRPLYVYIYIILVRPCAYTCATSSGD